MGDFDPVGPNAFHHLRRVHRPELGQGGCEQSGVLQRLKVHELVLKPLHMGQSDGDSSEEEHRHDEDRTLGKKAVLGQGSFDYRGDTGRGAEERVGPERPARGPDVRLRRSWTTAASDHEFGEQRDQVRTDPETEVELLELGADDFAQKPLDPHTFGLRVRAVLRRARS